MAWSSDAAKGLAASEAFQALFVDPECPVRQEIDRLTRIGLDPNSADDNRKLAIAKLAGMKKVYELVIQAADQPQATTAADERLTRRRMAGSYPFPSLVGQASPPSPESTGTDGHGRSGKWTNFFK